MTDEERYQKGQEIVKAVAEELHGKPLSEQTAEVLRRIQELVEKEDAVHESRSVVERQVAYFMAKPVEAQPERVSEEPIVAAPLRAFPDSFYYRPTPMTQVLDQEAERITEVFKEDLRPRWIPHRSKPEIAYPGQWCHCGHRWEEHMPCCVHLVEGCSCEEFMRVPMGHAEGG